MSSSLKVRMQNPFDQSVTNDWKFKLYEFAFIIVEAIF